MSTRVEVVCPCCATKLVVDGASGEVLSEDRPKADLSKTFDTALAEVKGGEQRRDEAFNKAFDRTQRLDDLLSKKFDEARRKAAQDPTAPKNPFDLD